MGSALSACKEDSHRAALLHSAVTTLNPVPGFNSPCLQLDKKQICVSFAPLNRKRLVKRKIKRAKRFLRTTITLNKK